jgi:hypothetical protein
MVVGLRRALEDDPQAFSPIRRKCRREDSIALDYTGIAVRGGFPCTAAVDQRNRQAALGEVNANRNADNPGPKNNYIAARHGTSAAFRKPCRSLGRAGKGRK